MSTQTLTLQIHLRISDEREFRQAARDRALVDGCTAAEAATYLNKRRTSLGQCGAMLFDPGTSPDGCQILDTSEAP